MTNKEKIKKFRKKTIEELMDILNNPCSSESDIIIASFEKQEKEEKMGIAKYYTTEEVLNNIFGNNMVANS